MTTIAELYEQGVAFLQAAGIEDPQLESAFFLSDILGLSRPQLFIERRGVASKDEELFRTYLKRRARHEPYAYIVGHQEFWGLDFIVSPSVLIPRPETELLVEQVLDLVSGKESFAGTILDLGTGSAILPVALSRELPQATHVAVDVSCDALDIALRNILKHGCEKKVSLLAADFLTAFKKNVQFDFIVSNPPYVKKATFDTLQPEVVNNEPHLALDGGGGDGLVSISSFAPAVAQYLRPGGWFLMEIGYDQKQEVLDLFASFSSFDHLTVLDDYAGLPRILKARRSL
ncbi:MAG: peptide chain release factor N(5)-glutamine methyltransferase [Thermodesulfobacteriota bacterium]